MTDRVVVIRERDTAVPVPSAPGTLVVAREAGSTVAVLREPDATLVVRDQTRVVAAVAAPANRLVVTSPAQGPPGRPGRDGVDGAAAQSFLWTQDVAAAVWTVPHNLGRAQPAVTVVDTAHSTVYGDVVYLDLNTAQIAFTVPFSGTAYLI